MSLQGIDKKKQKVQKEYIMKSTINKLGVGIFFICALLAVALVFSISGGTANLVAEASGLGGGFSGNDPLMEEQAYLSVHYADGTMGTLVDETYDPNAPPEMETDNFTHLQMSTTDISSGKPDNQSIVVVFLGDGFTAN